jgi:hypothetical protein
VDLLQIFQYDAGFANPIRALNNVPAPFLKCDPHFSVSQTHSTIWGDLARAVLSVFGPRPLYASTKRAMFDMGSGGSTDGFSRFQWALPSEEFFDFNLTADIQAIAPGTVINDIYSRLGVTFSRSNTLGLCPGSAIYANDYGVLGLTSGQNNISVCPEGLASDFGELDAGSIIATFTTPVKESCIEATPVGPPTGLITTGVAFIEAYDADGVRLSRTETTTDKTVQRICVSGDAIKSVRFAGAGAGYAFFDNFFFSRIVRN